MKFMLIKCRREYLSRKIMLSIIALVVMCNPVFAEGDAHPSKTISVLFNPLFIALLIIILLLLIAIIVFADVVKAAAYNHVQNNKKKTNVSSSIKSMMILVGTSLIANSLTAQNSEISDHSVNNTYYGLDSMTFYTMVAVISLEILIVWFLHRISLQLLGVKERKEQLEIEKAKQKIVQPSFIEKLNDSVIIEKEEDIMLDHNYDGIRELDNNLPPWWKYGFYLTIVFSVIYLAHFHMINTGKLQNAEYEDQLQEAKIQQEEYKKKAANLIDENNATLLTDEVSLGSGKAIFLDNCAACHGRAGEGGVGPNLTDDYWLHGGGIKDIFKTIKYGWPEKGMKSWQQDLGAKQIHEIASFIKSLRGTTPPNSKEKQGEFYKEGNLSDSTKINKIDSTQLVKEI